jgi:hypothetical protein
VHGSCVTDFDPEDDDAGAVLAGRSGSADPDAAMFDDDDDEDGAAVGGSRLLSERSHIRKNFDVEDISEEYRGRVVSRKQLDFGGGQQEDDEEEEDEEEGEDDDGEDAEEEEDEQDDGEDDEEEEEGEDDDEQDGEDEDDEDEDDEDEEDDDDEEEGGGGTKAMLASGLSDQQRQVQQQLAALEAEDAAGAGGAASLFQPRGAAASTSKGKTAPSSATSQYTKSLHMQNQLSWYTQLLNLRIRVQGVVAAANRLPAAADVSVADQAPSADAVDAVSVRQRFEAAAPAVTPAYSATLRGARKLLDELFDLQHELMQQNARLFAAGAGATEDEDEQDEEDEQTRSRIPRWQGLAGSKRRRATSEDETEAASDDEEEGANNGHGGGATADEQAAVDQYWQYLSGSLTPFFRPIQDALIDKWNTKTQLSAGQVAGGAGAGSSAFGQSGLAAAAAAGGKGGLKVINQSVLAQIDQLMLDESRLVRRSQLHRGANASSDAKNALLGRVEAERTRAAKRARRESAAVSDFDAAELSANGGGDAEDEEQYDGAIYDDNDYYQQLLAEIIAAASSSELGSGGVGGPAGGHDAAQLAKAAAAARKRGKRAGAGVVDRRASKGRKMRYVVHAKLANFMAPRAAPIADDYATRKAAAAAGAGSAAAALTGSGFALDELFINLFGGHGKKTLPAASQKTQAAAQ